MKVGGTSGRGWSAADITDQLGRTAVVTGADSGLGFETASMLAEHGATVVLACRDLDRARVAAARIRAGAPWSDVRVEWVDLASLASVRAAADRIRAAHPRLDLLINNAGVMLAPPGRTEDGFETTFGVNHLGPFALTGLLLDPLLATPGSRVVTVSSLVHRYGRLDLDRLSGRGGQPAERDDGDGGGWPGRSRLPYARSKLANLMFTYELQRRLAAVGAPTVAVAAHPGIARTDLVRNLTPPARVFMGARMAPVMSWLIQSPRAGALATVRAAVDPAVRGGEYYGPTGRFESTGSPAVAGSSPRSLDVDRQRRLWAASERLTGVSYELRHLVRRPSVPAQRLDLSPVG